MGPGQLGQNLHSSLPCFDRQLPSPLFLPILTTVRVPEEAQPVRISMFSPYSYSCTTSLYSQGQQGLQSFAMTPICLRTQRRKTAQGIAKPLRNNNPRANPKASRANSGGRIKGRHSIDPELAPLSTLLQLGLAGWISAQTNETTVLSHICTLRNDCMYKVGRFQEARNVAHDPKLLGAASQDVADVSDFALPWVIVIAYTAIAADGRDDMYSGGQVE